MAAFLPSAHAPKRAVVAFGEELAPILRLNTAAGHVQVTWRKHATRKPVKVRHFASENPFFLLSWFLLAALLALVCFESAIL